MWVAALVLASLALAAWVLLAAARGRRWPHEHVLPPTARPPDGEEVRAVVPARNEAASLPDTLPALRASHPSLASVTVVDDRSEDGTADVARRLARDDGAPVEVQHIDARPDGWAGKVYAMAVGVASLEERWTVPPDARWVFFTDADIHQPPDAVGRFLAQASRGPFDLVSVMARLRTETLWERLLIPAFVWFFQALYPFRRASDPRARTASAAGGAMLIRLEALVRAGGCAAWKGARIDDLALARGVKDAGGRLWVGFADDVVSTRPYPTLGSIVDMVARSAFEELRRCYLLVPVVWLALLFLFVVPPVAFVAGVFGGSLPLAVLGASGWWLQLVLVLPAYRHHRVPIGYALTMPIAAILYAWMTSVSAWRHLRGRGPSWRG